jgi:hypothetical protein
MRMYARVAVVGLGLLLAGCGDRVDVGGTEPPAQTTIPETISTTEIPTTSEDSMADQDIVQAAVSDLASRLGISEEAIEVVEVRAVQWPDGALGCPQEGKMYTQAVVDGTQVLLGFEERIYDYHAGPDGEAFLCPSGERDGGREFLPPPGNP